MSISHRSVVLCGLVCLTLMTATAGAALAASDAHLYAKERSYSSYGNAGTSQALAQEQYLGSYGERQSLSPSQSPIPSDDTPWLPITLSIAGVLIVAASATQLRRLRAA
jgi:hypothetical protein